MNTISKSPSQAIQDYQPDVISESPNLSGIPRTTLGLADSRIIGLIRLNTLEDRVELLEREILELKRGRS